MGYQGIHQPGDGVGVGNQVNIESQFSGRVRRDGSDAGNGHGCQKLFKGLFRYELLEISDRGGTGKGNAVDVFDPPIGPGALPCCLQQSG